MNWLQRQIAKVRKSWDAYWDKHSEEFEEALQWYYLNDSINGGKLI